MAQRKAINSVRPPNSAFVIVGLGIGGICLRMSSPANLAKATRLPVSVTAPIKPEAASAKLTSMGIGASGVPNATTYAPATRKDAAPPSPLNSATSSGIASSFTVFANQTPMPVPISTPTKIRL